MAGKCDFLPFLPFILMSGKCLGQNRTFILPMLFLLLKVLLAYYFIGILSLLFCVIVGILVEGIIIMAMTMMVMMVIIIIIIWHYSPDGRKSP
jgi:hypothetical protein